MTAATAIQIIAAAGGILTALLTGAVQRFGPASRTVPLFLLPGALACAVPALALLFPGLDPDTAPRLSLAAICLCAAAGLAAAWSVERDEPREGLRRKRVWLSASGAAGAACAASLLVPAATAAGAAVPPEGMVIVGPAGYAAALYLLACSVGALAGLEQTLRSSAEHVRWENKFLLLGMAGSFACMIYIASGVLLYPPRLTLLSLRSLQLFPAIFLVSCALIAVSWLRSSGRARVVVSHGVVYSSITLLGVGLYLIVSSLVITWAGRRGGAAFPIETLLFLLALLALAVALLWTDMRHRAKLWIRRNLLAGGYDYRAYWLEAGERIQSVQQPEVAAAALAEIVQRALGSVDVSVWVRLREPNRLRLLAARSGVEHLLPHEVTGIAEKFIDLQEPIGADEMRKVASDPQLEAFLGQTVAAVLVPLQSSGQLTGLLCVGADRSGKPYGWEAREFLGALGRHAAAEFHKADLLARLVQAKESEAFRTFSTFLLHDLKNFASTLSLIARNAEKHSDNPDFRQDAFRSIFQTAEKMKRLCNTLRAFSAPPAADLKTGDLNHVVRESADNFKGELGERLLLELEELPAVALDPEEMSRVVQNLLLNAREAIGPDGIITIRTRRLDGRVELSVEDNGRGMDGEFMQKGLFQPFRTTKSDGLGIGLFQCKKIVEAHRGSIAVESEAGRGTIVRVTLPCERPTGAESATDA